MTYWLTVEQAFPVLEQLIFGNDWHLLWGGTILFLGVCLAALGASVVIVVNCSSKV